MSEPAGVIAGLLEELTKLPGIGPKSAERIAHFLLAGDRRHAVELADALRAVADTVRPCRRVLQPDRRRTMPGVRRPEARRRRAVCGRNAARCKLVRARR